MKKTIDKKIETANEEQKKIDPILGKFCLYIAGTALAFFLGGFLTGSYTRGYDDEEKYNKQTKNLQSQLKQKDNQLNIFYTEYVKTKMELEYCKDSRKQRL